MSEILIKAEAVSKKFCKNLKRSIFYGMQDITRNIFGMNSRTDILRASEFWAIDNISFELKRGECLGLIGRNGSGKSTMLKLLNGIILPDKGRIEINGTVGALIEIGAGFHPLLTGRENIYINGRILGLTKRELNDKFDEIVEFSELAEFIDMPVKNYSSGMRVRLGFSIAAQLRPDILLIDEVLAVGDLGFRYKCFNKISEIMNQAAIIFVSHDMSQVARICTDLILLNNGKSIYQERDVIHGIQHYNSQFDFPESFIAGNGKAKLCDIKLSSKTGKSDEHGVTVIEYGEDLIIDMTVILKSEVENINIVINILDHQQRAVMQCMSCNAGLIVQNHGKPIDISVILPKINLNPSVYHIWIVVSDGLRREVFLAHYGIETFRVTGPFIGVCSVQIDARWEIDA